MRTTGLCSSRDLNRSVESDGAQLVPGAAPSCTGPRPNRQQRCLEELWRRREFEAAIRHARAQDADWPTFRPFASPELRGANDQRRRRTRCLGLGSRCCTTASRRWPALPRCRLPSNADGGGGNVSVVRSAASGTGYGTTTMLGGAEGSTDEMAKADAPCHQKFRMTGSCREWRGVPARGRTG